jgi:hypothetical protein
MRDTFFTLLGGNIAAWMTLLSATVVQAENGATASPVTERFSTAETREVPDFQRHVSPLLGRLGCNGRSCHGSFQGQGNFR